MIAYTEQLPSILYAVDRERIRRGDGLRVIKTEGKAEWISNQIDGVVKPWGVRVGKSVFTLKELYVDQAEARNALEACIARELRYEQQKYRELTQRLNASRTKT